MFLSKAEVRRSSASCHYATYGRTFARAPQTKALCTGSDDPDPKVKVVLEGMPRAKQSSSVARWLVTERGLDGTTTIGDNLGRRRSRPATFPDSRSPSCGGRVRSGERGDAQCVLRPVL